MNNPIKIGVYVILAIAMLWFGLSFYSEYKKIARSVAASTSTDTNEVIQQTNLVEQTNAAVESTTNSLAASTNAPAPANAPSASIAATNSDTNSVAVDTNGVATATNVSVAANADLPAEPIKKIGKGKMMTYGGAFLGALLVFGLLLAYDMSQMIGTRSIDFMFNDNLEGVHDAEYEQAEQLWANGKPLDAIQALRDYLKANPREIHVAKRIAEIYEKDLKNYLAAILEYEEILKPHPKFRLSDNTWGWSAIHLCNLYNKTGNTEKSLALLRRIVDEYGETPAATKARKRLAMYESIGDVESLTTDAPEDARTGQPPPPRPEAAKPKRVRVRVVPKAAEEKPASNLPPGFRPKTKS